MCLMVFINNFHLVSASFSTPIIPLACYQPFQRPAALNQLLVRDMSRWSIAAIWIQNLSWAILLYELVHSRPLALSNHKTTHFRQPRKLKFCIQAYLNPTKRNMKLKTRVIYKNLCNLPITAFSLNSTVSCTLDYLLLCSYNCLPPVSGSMQKYLIIPQQLIVCIGWWFYSFCGHLQLSILVDIDVTTSFVLLIPQNNKNLYIIQGNLCETAVMAGIQLKENNTRPKANYFGFE